MESLASSVTLIYWVFYTVLFLVAYHKVFIVGYFNLFGGLLKELITAVIVGGILAVASIVFWWIGVIVIIIVALVAVGKVDSPNGKVVIVVMAIIACIIVAVIGQKVKKESTNTLDNSKASYNKKLEYDDDYADYFENYDNNDDDYADRFENYDNNDYVENNSERYEGEDFSENPIPDEIYDTQNDGLSDFIFPNSDRMYLDRADLEGLSAAECRIARNEIYARHGRIFKDEELQAYFKQFDWYIELFDANKFEESVLNKYEKANRDLILKYESDMGY